MHQTKSAYEYNSQFKEFKIKYNKNKFLKQIKLLTKVLKKYNIYFLHMEWDEIWNMIDYAWEDAANIVAESTNLDEYSVYDKVSMMLITEHTLFWAVYSDGIVYIPHYLLKKDINLVHKIFTKIFGKKYVWDKNTKKTIKIKLDKL